VNIFDFDESEVGEYGEVVYAVVVPPLVREGGFPSPPCSVAGGDDDEAAASTRSSAGTCPLDGGRRGRVPPREGG